MKKKNGKEEWKMKERKVEMKKVKREEIIKQFYLNHIWDPNRYYNSASKWTWE